MKNINNKEALRLASKYSVISVMMYSMIRVLSLMIPLIMKSLIDRVNKGGLGHHAYLLLAVLTIIPGLVTLIDVGYFRWINGKVWLIALDINHQVFINLLRKPYTYFMKNKSGELLNLYKSDITKMFSYMMIERPKLISQGLIVIIINVFLFKLSPWIVLVQLILIPLILFPSKYMVRKTMSLSKSIFSNNGLRMNIVSEAFEKIKMTKINKFENYYSELLKTAHKNLLKSWQSVLTYDVLANGWASTFIGPLNLGLSFFIGLTLVNQQKLSLGSLVLILSYVPMVTSFFNEVANKSLNYAQKNEEFSQITQLLKEDLQEERPNTIRKIESITMENVSFKHDQQQIFCNVSVDLKVGQFIGLVGENGSGKTSFLDLMFGLYSDYEGKIFANGICLNTIDQSVYLDRISYMVQDVELPSTTIRKCFLLFNQTLNESQMIELLTKLKMWDVIVNREGLDTEINGKATNFSGGEKRKLYLAMVLSKDSDILVLDEITANMDADTIDVIYDVLSEMKDKREKLIIAINHDMSFSDLYDHIIDMNQYK